MLRLRHGSWRRMGTVHPVQMLSFFSGSLSRESCLFWIAASFSNSSLADLARRPTMDVGQLNCFLKCSIQSYTRRFWKRITGPSGAYFTCLTLGFRGPVFLISRLISRLLPIATGFSISLRFPVDICSQSFTRLLVSWSFRDLRGW